MQFQTLLCYSYDMVFITELQNEALIIHSLRVSNSPPPAMKNSRCILANQCLLQVPSPGPFPKRHCPDLACHPIFRSGGTEQFYPPNSVTGVTNQPNTDFGSLLLCSDN